MEGRHFTRSSAITPTWPALEASGRTQTDGRSRCVSSTLRAASPKMKAQAGFFFNSKFIVMRAENSRQVMKCSEGWPLSRAGKCCCRGAGGSRERDRGPLSPRHCAQLSPVRRALLSRLVEWITWVRLPHWFSCSVVSDSATPWAAAARLLRP